MASIILTLRFCMFLLISYRLQHDVCLHVSSDILQTAIWRLSACFFWYPTDCTMTSLCMFLLISYRLQHDVSLRLFAHFLFLRSWKYGTVHLTRRSVHNSGCVGSLGPGTWEWSLSITEGTFSFILQVHWLSPDCILFCMCVWCSKYK